MLASAGTKAEAQARILNAEEQPTVEFIELHLRQYVLQKYTLPPDTSEDDIRALARESLKITLRLNKDALHELDKAAPCNHATSETTKKVLLLYAVQRDLHLPENPAELASVQTVSGLARYIWKNWGKRKI